MTACGLEVGLVHACTYFRTMRGTKDNTATTSAASTILSAACSASRNCLEAVQQTDTVLSCQVQQHCCWLSCSNSAAAVLLTSFRELHHT